MAIANLIYRVHGPVTEKKNQEIVDEFLSFYFRQSIRQLERTVKSF